MPVTPETPCTKKTWNQVESCALCAKTQAFQSMCLVCDRIPRDEEFRLRIEPREEEEEESMWLMDGGKWGQSSCAFSGAIDSKRDLMNKY